MTYKCACFVLCLMHLLLGSAELNVGGDFWGLMRHSKRERLSVPVMKSSDVLMAMEKGSFCYFVFIMLKEDERKNLCFLKSHGDTFVRSLRLSAMSSLADGCADSLQTFMSSRRSHTESLPFTPSNRLSASCHLGCVLCNVPTRWCLFFRSLKVLLYFSEKVVHKVD